MAKISICIPVYGVEKYIEQCARSLFEQTIIEDVEFIFVNDCTKDKSIDILKNILREYPQRIKQTKIISHEHNSGLVAARNTALKHSTGDYIIHCDSDDWVDFDFYEKLYNQASKTDADVVFAPILIEFVNNEREKKKIIPVYSKTSSGYIDKNCGKHLNSLCSKLYKKEIALSSSLY